jgi:hypothetical protein
MLPAQNRLASTSSIQAEFQIRASELSALVVTSPSRLATSTPPTARRRSVDERGRTWLTDTAAAGLMNGEREGLGMRRATLARLIWGKSGDRRIHALFCLAAQKFVTCTFKAQKIHGIYRESEARAKLYFGRITTGSYRDRWKLRLLDRTACLR